MTVRAAQLIDDSQHAKRVAQLYAIETTIRGQPAAERLSTRQSKSLPLVIAMKDWLGLQLNSIAPRSGLADAIR